MTKICMVVDDSSVVRKLCHRIVAAYGFEVIEAEDGKDALEKSAQKKPDVILLDWNMPVMDGMEFLLAYPDKGHTKIIFCTAENDVNKIMEAMAAGADEYIMKPFDEEIVKTKFAQMGLLKDD